MTLPPPCFTDEVVCLGSWAVPFLLHTLLFPSLWYKLILVSSVHRMLFQNCEGFFRCRLANSNLAFLFLMLTNGLHLVVNPLYSLWWSLLLIVDFDTHTRSGYILANRLPTTSSNRQSKLWYTPFTNTRWVTRKAQCYFLFSQHGTIERHKARGLRSKRRGTSKKNSKLKFTQTGINSQVLVKYWLLFIAELLERNYIWNIRI